MVSCVRSAHHPVLSRDLGWENWAAFVLVLGMPHLVSPVSEGVQGNTVAWAGNCPYVTASRFYRGKEVKGCILARGMDGGRGTLVALFANSLLQGV